METLGQLRAGTVCPNCRVIARGSVCARCSTPLSIARTGVLVSAPDIKDWIGIELADPVGARIGIIEALLRDPRSEHQWLTVNLARFGERRTLVPSHGAKLLGQRLWAGWEVAVVRAAPPAGTAADATLIEALERYYGLALSTSPN